MRTARATTSPGSWMTAPGCARGQRSVGAYASGRQNLRRQQADRRSPRLEGVASRQPEEEKGPVERGDGPRDGVGQRSVADRHVVERTVSFDVLEPDALGTRESLERADLVQDEVLDLRGRHAHRSAAKSDQIRKARMRTNRNAIVAREPDRRRMTSGSPA